MTDVLAALSAHYRDMDAKRLRIYLAYGGEKPRLYWTRCPKLKRGFWRVSPMPKLRSQTTLDLWAYAHNMAREMNYHQGTEQ